MFNYFHILFFIPLYGTQYTVLISETALSDHTRLTLFGLYSFYFPDQSCVHLNSKDPTDISIGPDSNNDSNNNNRTYNRFTYLQVRVHRPQRFQASPGILNDPRTVSNSQRTWTAQQKTLPVRDPITQ